MLELTELQKTQIAYAHFTLQEWQCLAAAMSHTLAYFHGTPHGPQPEVLRAALEKFPSAVL
jgi:hypothetical protein